MPCETEKSQGHEKETLSRENGRQKDALTYIPQFGEGFIVGIYLS